MSKDKEREQLILNLLNILCNEKEDPRIIGILGGIQSHKSNIGTSEMFWLAIENPSDGRLQDSFVTLVKKLFINLQPGVVDNEVWQEAIARTNRTVGIVEEKAVKIIKSLL
ncbi:MAG: hypothetical protein ABIE68_04320 [bacterium]